MQSRISLFPLEKFWSKQPRWVRALALAIIGFSVEFMSDAITHQRDAHWVQVHLIEDAGFAILYFGIGFWLATTQDKAVRRRSELMGYLNHHCRNALQAIAFAHVHIASPEVRKKEIDDAIQRIVNTLVRVSKEERVAIEELLADDNQGSF